MNGHQCAQCRTWWASQSGQDQFLCITTFCPNCLPKLYPQVMPPEHALPPMRLRGVIREAI